MASCPGDMRMQEIREAGADLPHGVVFLSEEGKISVKALVKNAPELEALAKELAAAELPPNESANTANVSLQRPSTLVLNDPYISGTTRRQGGGTPVTSNMTGSELSVAAALEEQEKEVSALKVKVAYIVEQGLDLDERLSAMKNLKIACLCANRITSLQTLGLLQHLELLDVSDNLVQFIAPAQTVLFRQLHVLYLHRNMVRRTNSLKGLQNTQHLRILTLTGNPVDKDEYYRPGVFSAVPSLIILDRNPKIPHDYAIAASQALGEKNLDPDLVALANGETISGNVHEKIQEATVHRLGVILDMTLEQKEMPKLHQKHVRRVQTEQELEKNFKISILHARNPRDRFNHEFMVDWILRRFLMNRKLLLPMTYHILSSSSSLNSFNMIHVDTVEVAHRLFACCNPVLVLQRCMRGHWSRKYFRKYRIKLIMATISLQRWLYRRNGFMQNLSQKLVELMHTCHTTADCALQALPFSTDGVLYENLIEGVGNDMYFLPNDILRLQEVLTSFKTMSAGVLPQLYVSNLVLQSVHPGTIWQWVPYFPLQARREYRDRPRDKAFRLSSLRHGVDSTSSLRIISRRGMSCSTAQVNLFEKAYEAKYSPVLAPKSVIWQRRYLLVLRFASTHSRGIFVRVLNNMNARAHPTAHVKFLLQEIVARLVATCTIHCTVRSWLKRRWMHPSLGTAVFALRAIRLIQRWWRWRILGFGMFKSLRMDCLTQLRKVVEFNGEAAVLYCFANNMKERMHECKMNIQPLIREAKYHFDFDDNSAVFVHKGSSWLDEDSPSPDNRPFLPNWVGMRVMKTSAYQTDNGNVDTAGIFPKEVPSHGKCLNIKKILQTGCHVQLAHTEGRSAWDSSSGDQVGTTWRLPRKSMILLSSQPVLRLTFSSALEARRRMAFLMIRTFTRTRDPVKLLSNEIAVKHVYAMHMQAVFRGFLTRRWWRLITAFMHEKLHTSFLEQRGKSTTTPELTPEDELFQKLPDKMKTVLKNLNVSAQTLSDAILRAQDLSRFKVKGSRGYRPSVQVPVQPFDRIPRDEEKKSLSNSENAPEMRVQVPLAACKGYGGGLPSGEVAAVKNKQGFGYAMRREKQELSVTRWANQMMGAKKKSESFKPEQILKEKSQPHQNAKNLPGLRDIYTRTGPVKGYFPWEIAKIQEKIMLQKTSHAKVLRYNQIIRFQENTAKRRASTPEQNVIIDGRPNSKDSVFEELLSQNPVERRGNSRERNMYREGRPNSRISKSVAGAAPLTHSRHYFSALNEVRMSQARPWSPVDGETPMINIFGHPSEGVPPQMEARTPEQTCSTSGGNQAKPSDNREPEQRYSSTSGGKGKLCLPVQGSLPFAGEDSTICPSQSPTRERERTPAETRLPSLLTRVVDRANTQRIKSAEQAAMKERKTQTLQMKVANASSVHQSNEYVKIFKKMQVYSERRKLEALKLHREFIADKWELMMQQKADFGIQATRPATSAINPLPHDLAAGMAVVGIHPKRPSTHIDLVRYVSTPDTGSRRMALPDLDDSKVKWSPHFEEKSNVLRRDDDTFGVNMQDAPIRVAPSSQSVAESSPLHRPTSSTSGSLQVSPLEQGNHSHGKRVIGAIGISMMALSDVDGETEAVLTLDLQSPS